MQEVTYKANGKINLGLQVFPKRPDGYHDIKSVMVKIGLGDVVKLKWDPGDFVPDDGRYSIRVTTDAPHIPAGERNLAYKAAKEYYDCLYAVGLADLLPRQVCIQIEKSIPAGAGMGGGSADAAASIRLLDAIARRELKVRQLPLDILEPVNIYSIASVIGSDVPFFLGGPASLATGRGEVLESVDIRAKFWVLCVMPEGSLATKSVYELFDRVGSDARCDINAVRYALACDRPELLPESAGNSLERAAMSLLPSVGEVKQMVCSLGPLFCSMTGSGSCVYGLFRERDQAEQALRAVRSSSKAAWSTLTETLNEVC